MQRGKMDASTSFLVSPPILEHVSVYCSSFGRGWRPLLWQCGVFFLTVCLHETRAQASLEERIVNPVEFSACVVKSWHPASERSLQVQQTMGTCQEVSSPWESTASVFKVSCIQGETDEHDCKRLDVHSPVSFVHNLKYNRNTLETWPCSSPYANKPETPPMATEPSKDPRTVQQRHDSSLPKCMNKNFFVHVSLSHVARIGSLDATTKGAPVISLITFHRHHRRFLQVGRDAWDCCKMAIAEVMNPEVNKLELLVRHDAATSFLSIITVVANKHARPGSRHE